MNKNKNIFLIVLVSLVILMIVPSISAEATNNEHWNAGNVPDIPEQSRIVDLGNGLMRYDRVHYAKDNMEANSVITPGGSINDYYLMGVEWKVAEPFVVNSYKSGLNEGEVLQIINTSLSTWDDETPFEIFGDVSLDPSVKKARYDRKNSVTFRPLRSGVIAVAYTWASNGEIVESDVMFSTRYTWSTSGEAGKIDIQNIATHEFGHSAGLLDLYQGGHSELTMYGYSWYGETKKQSLEAGDIAGIHAIYGM